MPTFEQGDVVRVPFPYTDRQTRQHRPALVVSNGGIGEHAQFLWVVMITSAENRRWPDDQDIGPNYRDVGLPAPSIIRPTKIATIESRDASAIGRIPRNLLGRVQEMISRNLAL
jgi:mRNA interferase MazF